MPVDDPDLTAALRTIGALVDTVPADRRVVRGDTRTGEVYILNDKLVTALKVALVTGRPLLLGGPPGSGKSSIAGYVARNLGVEYLEFVTTDDARATDLLARFDAVRRLGDAQAQRLPPASGRAELAAYVEPGPLWWALNPASARRRGLPADEADTVPPATPPQGLLDHEARDPGAVLLIDEIDKSDSSFPNGLLVPLGSGRFTVPVLDVPVEADPARPSWSPLVIITTNNERDLPEAFLRRCVTLRLDDPKPDHLVRIVQAHYGASITSALAERVRRLAEEVTRADATGEGARPVSSAEFLDLVNVLLTLGDDDIPTWNIVKQVTLRKHDVYAQPEESWS